MNEIYDEEFQALYPKIEKALKEASFIGIDAEFTGITHDVVSDSTLFDSMQQRYDKLKQNIDSYIAIQIGITTFTKLKNENKYIARPFSFYLQPKISLDGKDREYRWQASAVEFLKAHKFDFQKAYYSGISYLDEQDEFSLRNYLKQNEYGGSDSCLIGLDESNRLFNSINQVTKWLKDPPSTDEKIEIECENFIQTCCLQKHLRNTFKNIWTEQVDDKVVVIKVCSETREILEEKHDGSLEDQLLDYYMGFTKVFKILSTIKKPIVGHNLLLDLMFMYKQFCKPLPRKYLDFKSEIHRILPVVFDTKFLSYELKNVMEIGTWKSNSLGDLYMFFKHQSGQYMVGNSPQIEIEGGVKIEKEMFHDAGWDSFYTGFCFVKIAHAYASKKRGGKMGIREFTHAELIAGIQDGENCVNLIRADRAYLRLGGIDPPSSRPPRLNFQTLEPKPINISQVMKALSPFETVAVQPYSKKSVLVATPNYRTAREILQHFEKSKSFHVALHSPLKHSPVVRSLLWGGLLLSGGLLTWLIHQNVQKPSIA